MQAGEEGALSDSIVTVFWKTLTVCTWILILYRARGRRMLKRYSTMHGIVYCTCCAAIMFGLVSGCSPVSRKAPYSAAVDVGIQRLDSGEISEGVDCAQLPQPPFDERTRYNSKGDVFGTSLYRDDDGRTLVFYWFSSGTNRDDEMVYAACKMMDYGDMSWRGDRWYFCNTQLLSEHIALSKTNTDYFSKFVQEAADDWERKVQAIPGSSKP